jgi:hypothetical protein
MKISDVLSFAALVASMVIGLNFFVYRKDDQDIKARLDSLSKANYIRIKNVESRVDSLKSNETIFAKSILYLDSCQMNKTMKADRAEKRGRFLGGLIKGLFPGM